MADFRKVILALVVLALFAGLAGAQTSNSSTQCSIQAVTPQLRAEGLTELVGDIYLNCVGGTSLAPGSLIPTTNITVYLNATVTSRLLGNASVTTASEALLLIDEPGNGASGYGNQVPLTPCAFPNQGAGQNGCTQWVGNSTVVTTPAGQNIGVPVASNPNTNAGGTFNPAAVGPGANVFQGVTSGSQVTFFGVPVLPPTTSGSTHVYRITNVRLNATVPTGGGLIPANASAYVATGGGTGTLTVPNSVLVVGYISQSLKPSVNKALSSSAASATSIALQQCTSPATSLTQPVFALDTLRYSETQGNAFKVRGSTNQTLPGWLYNTESGFTATGVTGTISGTGTTLTAGLADWGTRLKAVFSNIPSGVSLYVSTSNLNGTLTGGAVLNGTASSYAALINSETSADIGYNPSATPPPGVGAGPAAPGSFLPTVTQTASYTPAGGTAIPYVPLTVSNGSASAVWEVVNSLPNTQENYDFEVFVTYSNAVSGVPPIGTMTVNMSYAPIPTQGAFTLAQGGAASQTLGIPRFADTSTSANALTIQVCQTALLYPFVINVAGDDTGLAVANTSQDPWGTTNQTGYCTINWYGTGGPAVNPGYLGNAGYQTTVPTSSQLIAAGTVQTWGTSSVAPGFFGYVIATCNFDYAHGYAFVSDLGTRNWATAYLADILNTAVGTVGVRGATATPAPVSHKRADQRIGPIAHLLRDIFYASSHLGTDPRIASQSA